MFFVGVDVGTGSARAGVFGVNGELQGSHEQAIVQWNSQPDFYEQSSDDIWNSVCESVHRALEKAHVTPSEVHGIGFAATCSLVLLDELDQPVSASLTGEPERNIILWMDHRAKTEARFINETCNRLADETKETNILTQVGGAISPEMEPPKILWLKKNLPASFDRTKKFFDLTDFLTYKCSNDEARSVCTVTCKWLFQSDAQKWSNSFWSSIGLDELTHNNFQRIGTNVLDIGSPLGKGLTEKAALDLGLLVGTPVAVGLIDAHSGGLGTLGGSLEPSLGEISLAERMALICGTSTCHMASTASCIPVPGIWGPYFSAMIPGLWLLEGGQSATGALVNHVVQCHPAYHELKENVTFLELFETELHLGLQVKLFNL